MRYPYYIVEWTEGRLAGYTPPHLRGTPIAKMFKSGRIGGKRRHERTFHDLREAIRELDQHRSTSELLVVEGPRQQRKRIRNPIAYLRTLGI